MSGNPAMGFRVSRAESLTHDARRSVPDTHFDLNDEDKMGEMDYKTFKHEDAPPLTEYWPDAHVTETCKLVATKIAPSADGMAHAELSVADGESLLPVDILMKGADLPSAALNNDYIDAEVEYECELVEVRKYDSRSGELTTYLRCELAVTIHEIEVEHFEEWSLRKHSYRAIVPVMRGKAMLAEDGE